MVMPSNGTSLAPCTYDGAVLPGGGMAPAFIGGPDEPAAWRRSAPPPAHCSPPTAHCPLPTATCPLSSLMPSTRRSFIASTGAGLSALAAPALDLSWAAPYDLVLRGGTVFDGTGAPGRVSDVAVRAGKIAAVARRIARSSEEQTS